MHNTDDVAQQILHLESEIKKYLDRDAVVRLGTIKTAHPELALRVVMTLAELIKQGKIKGVIPDEQFKMILKQLTLEKKDITIRR